MKHPDYPLGRAELNGTLKLYDGARPASNALLVLAAPQPDWQVQVLNYIFSTRADAQGHFRLPHVRPGTYTLYAAVPGVTDQFRRDNLMLKPNQNLDLGVLNFVPAYYSARLWQIGTPDLRTTGFRLSDQPRQYGLDHAVPADLTYVIGTSVPSRDWYYSQAKPGEWNIDFKVERAYGGEGVLTVSVAGQTRNPRLQISVNGTPVGNYSGGNSSAGYRSAILGSSYHENKIFRFPASLLRRGDNRITLKLAAGEIMYDALKLEIDDPALPKQVPAAD